jgi:hypothetical protein
VLTAVAVALVLRLVYGPWSLNYDARYALLWAQDLVNGFSPEYEAAFAPTPRPLQTAAGLLLLPFGDAADDALSIATLLAFGALAWLVYRLGERLFGSPWVGAIAALVVVTRPVLERDALLAYQDIPFAALVVGAVLLEAKRRRRGAPVLIVLAVAGLVRPEAWALAGLYVLWLWPGRSNRERAAYVALAAAAPLIWAATDWLVTGDPLHSLHGTADLAVTNDRRRTVGEVPYWTATYFGAALREPLVLGVPIGLAFAYFHARRPALLPLVVVAAMVAVFAVGPLFGLPLIRRYIDTPAVLLTLFYGLAVAGWTLLPPGRGRRGWLIAGVLAALLSVAYLPWHGKMLANLERRMDRDSVFYGDLRAAAKAPAVKAAFDRCPNLTAGDHTPMPYARHWLDGAPGSVGTVEGDADPLGDLLLMPLRGPTTRRFYQQGYPAVRTPQGWRTIYENRSWRVSAAPRCSGA